MSEPDSLPPCPACEEVYTYEQGTSLACPMCGHEWVAEDGSPSSGASAEITDAVGNVLADGDTVTIVKGLKIKGGGGGTLKAGTKVKGIRLEPNGTDGHDIAATVAGFGRMQLKSSVVKKAGC